MKQTLTTGRRKAVAILTGAAIVSALCARVAQAEDHDQPDHTGRSACRARSTH